MATQTELFSDLRPAGKPRPHVRQPPVGIEAPLWTIDKSRLIDEYLHHFLLVTKHGVYLDLFAGRNTQLTPRIGPSGGFWNGAPRATLPFVTTRCATSSASRRTGCGILGGTTPRSASMKVMPTSAFTRCWREHLLLRRRRASALSTSVRSNATGLPWKQSHNTSVKAIRSRCSIFSRRSGWTALGPAPATARNWRHGGATGTTQHFRTLRSVERAIALCKRFRDELGYAYAVPFAIHEKGAGSRTMYYMIHASDHPAAAGLMARAYLRAQPKENGIALKFKW